MNKQLEQEVRLLKLKELKREEKARYKKASERTGACLGLAIIFGLFWMALIVGWIKDPCKDKLGYFWGFIFLSAINLFSILIFRHEWRKQSTIEKEIKKLERQIQELENPSRKLSDMSTIEQLIYYFIKKI